MGALFSSPKVPEPAPLPESPIQSELRTREREIAAATASTNAAMGGRRSTVRAGSAIAMEKQAGRIRKRGVAADELGAL